MSDDVVSGRVTVDPALVFAINRTITLNDAARRRQARIAAGVSWSAKTHRRGCTCPGCPATISEAEG